MRGGYGVIGATGESQLRIPALNDDDTQPGTVEPVRPIGAMTPPEACDCMHLFHLYMAIVFLCTSFHFLFSRMCESFSE